ncbi:MAG TPA: hypothetical protein VLG09_02575 [Candidatus Saccharimonadales bacterium]|nr:hypothetical protein [Candidatus Saccharimonadales bacterium]
MDAGDGIIEVMQMQARSMQHLAAEVSAFPVVTDYDRGYKAGVLKVAEAYAEAISEVISSIKASE